MKPPFELADWQAVYALLHHLHSIKPHSDIEGNVERLLYPTS